MAPDPKHQAARKKVRTAQKQFEREASAANELRRKSFAQAQKEGLSLREIGEEDCRDQAAVLRQILDLHPEPLTLAELTRK